MLDSSARRWLGPTLDRLGRQLAARRINADQLTVVGCLFGLGAAVAVLAGAFWFALVLFATGRVIDGLDGAVARATATTDRGGYLDIVLDFVVYAAIPLAFAMHDPARNAVAACFLLAAIILNGSAFLAFAVMAARRGLETSQQGEKSLYFLAGLAEGSETIIVYVLALMFPDWFAGLAVTFAGLCALSGAARIVMAYKLLQ